MKKLVAILAALAVLFCCGLNVAAAEIDNVPYDSYTYWDENGDKFLAGNRVMYEVEKVVYDSAILKEPLSEPKDLAIDKDGKIYILDSGNSRIVILSPDYKLLEVINDFGGETFSEASGILIANNGDIYVADTANMRIIVGNIDGKLDKIIACPEDDFIPDDFEFNPIQMTLDKNGYLYVLSNGSFYGALVFSPEGKAEGFFGANRVNASVGDIIDTLWNRWFMTDEQRSSQIQKIPYQFSDLCADDKGLIYTTTGATTNYGSQSGQIRCLGPAGTNVLKKRVNRTITDADSFNFVDKGQAQLAVGQRIQNFVSIDVAEGYIYALDNTYGKVFVYSENCELLTVFGGGVQKGNQKGTFENAVALRVFDDKIFVLDGNKGCLTVFSVNEYGSMVKKAALLTASGKYLEAKPIWEKVISNDRNCQLAYGGLARAALAEKNYTLAMDYAKQGGDRGIYDQSYEYVRNDFLEKNIGWIFLGVFLIIGSVIALFVLKYKGKLPSVNAPKLRIALTASFHPFENMQAVKYKKMGSLIIATALLVLYYISGVLEDFYTGFVHSNFSVENYNSILTLLGSVGVVILWVIGNWSVSVLAEGKGKIKEVYTVACYSLVPQILNSILCLIMSNVLLEKEAMVLTVITTVSMILTGIILCIGTMIIHEFDFFKFFWTAVLTLIAMAIVIFLGFMIVILLQQFFAFIRTVYIEVTYR